MSNASQVAGKLVSMNSNGNKLELGSTGVGPFIKCPVCGGEYTKTLPREAVYEIEDKNDWSSGRGVRGGVLVIPMECEEGHIFELNVGFHKGFTILTASTTEVQGEKKDFGWRHE